MIFNKIEKIDFFKLYKKFNFLSLIFIIFSIIFLVFKGLNFGVDFKGGTLIELRPENSQVKISEIRQSFLKMNLGDVNVKKYVDYETQFEKVFVEPLTLILNTIRWSVDRTYGTQGTLEDFF